MTADIAGDGAGLDTPLEGGVAARERAAGEFETVLLEGEAVLHLERERTAERIEAEDRIGGLQIGAANREIRHLVPVDRVAECFVDAGAVLVDGDAGRGAENRRGGKAAKLQIGLKRAARHVV